jgi:Styrene monooxygenase A putative substrate binding domain
MSDIGIIGSGISGLMLALSLQRAGVGTVVYAERAGADWARCRLPNTVARYGPTMVRERRLGIDHWDGVEVGIECLEFSVTGTPIGFSAPMPHGGSGVDFRLYLPRLLHDYTARGGAVVVGAMDAEAIRAVAPRHDLIVVATGRDGAEDLFPRDPLRSVHDRPQRLLCAGVWEGIDPSSRAITASSSPEAGEIFSFPYYSRDRCLRAVLVEAIPGGPLEAITELAYVSSPERFAAAMSAIVREHAPTVHARISPASFRLTGPLDVFQGAITPTVRRGSCELGGGRFAVALGDAWVVNDPIAGQGANLGSACAERLAELIVEQRRYDDAFCAVVDRELWAIAEPVCWWSNSMLTPAPAHVAAVLEAASKDQAVADAFIANFAAPAAMHAALCTEQAARTFLASVSPGREPGHRSLHDVTTAGRSSSQNHQGGH